MKKEGALVLWYFICTLFFSWLFFVPGAIFFKDVVNPEMVFRSPVFILLQTFGAAVPSVTAIIFIRHHYGKNFLDKAFKRHTKWKFKKKWYVFSILLYPVITILSIAIYMLYKGQLLFLDPNTALGGMTADLGIFVLIIIPVIFLTQLVSSPLLEEFGWRGFALPFLQKRYNALISSIILGFIWGVWHLPLAYTYSNNFALSELLLTIDMVALSIIMTWLFNSTKGSMVTPMLFHASLNLSIASLDVGEPAWISHSLTWVVAIFLLIIYGPENMASQKRTTEIV